jgi:hypothetical protein
MEVSKNIPGVDTWYPVIAASILVGRNSDAFGCLFGAAFRRDMFAPIAAGRGLPDNVSTRVKEEAAKYDQVDGFVWPTWVSWAELDRVDWDDSALRPGLPDQTTTSMRHRDALDDEWWSLFALMRELAKRFTPDGVRLIVWFYF